MSTRTKALGLRAPAGISLIEVMLCLTILAVVALAMADGLVASLRVTSTNEEREAAMRAARDKLEWVSAHKDWLVYSDPSTGPIQHSYDSSGTYTHFNIDDAPGSKDHGCITQLVWGISPNPGPIPPPPGGYGTVDTNNLVLFDVYYNQKGEVANTAAGAVNASRLQPLFSTAAAAKYGTQGGDHVGEIVVMFDRDITAARPDGTYAYGRDLTGGPAKPDAPFGTPNGAPDGTTFAPLPFMDPSNSSGGDVRITALNPISGGGIRGMIPVGVVIRWAGSSGREERVELWTVLSFFMEDYSISGGGGTQRYD